MKAIIFNLVLQEPLLATQANSAEPNSSISHSYIPGSMIRGALVGRFVKKYKVSDLANDETGYDMFLSGKVRFLNAYLFQGERLLPKPMSWLVEKGQESDLETMIYDFAIDAETPELERPKAPAGEFVHYGADHVWLTSPIRHVQVHNASTEPGRKAAGTSQVYRYDALAAEQTFQAVILADDEVDLTPLTRLLSQTHFVLGRSSTGGYGLVKVEIIKESSSWQEYEVETAPDNYYVITCLSDLILRDENGQLSASLRHALNLPATVEVMAFQKLHLVGGFNNKWGLPLPQAMAIQAGSVFRIAKDAVTEDVLLSYVQRGIGERTIEGFGRIALNLHTQKTQYRTKRPSESPEIPPKLSDSSRELAKTMANRKLRQQLESYLIEVVQDHKKFANLPSTSQLSRVRLAARHALAIKDLTVVANHMDNIKGARSSWEKARLDRQSLADWIKQHSQLDKAKFSNLFNLTGKLPAIAGEESEIDNRLEIEFRTRLIDGVMQQAVLQKQEEDAKQSGRRVT